jgi:hypothetical protein
VGIADVIALSAWDAVGLNPETPFATTVPAEGAATRPPSGDWERANRFAAISINRAWGRSRTAKYP